MYLDDNVAFIFKWQEILETKFFSFFPKDLGYNIELAESVYFFSVRKVGGGQGGGSPGE